MSILDISSVGATIKEIREQKGLSRDEVIRLSPYWSYQAWTRVEQGRRQLAVWEVPSVAIAFNMDAVELFLLLVATKKPPRSEGG